MYKRVNWLTFWLVGAVTCGIYALIVWNGMTRDMNDMADKVGENRITGFIPSIFLGIITCGIYSIVWLFKFYGLMGRLSNKYNACVMPENTFVKFLIAYVPVFSFYWLATSFNMLADAAEA